MTVYLNSSGRARLYSGPQAQSVAGARLRPTLERWIREESSRIRELPGYGTQKSDIFQCPSGDA